MARGDHQREDVDYFETWAPVCHWSTIRTMMMIAAKERLCSAQCDITAAFLLAKLPKGEDIYVSQPQGFMRDPSYVLKLNRTLYGLKQAPRYFFAYLSKRLERQGLVPSKHDPCLFSEQRTCCYCVCG